MKLFYTPGACSLAPHILLNEAAIPHEAIKVDLRAKTYEGGDFRKINPKGYVPTLQLANGQLLTENAVILQYIADQKPEAHLIPKAGSFERYRLLEWENFIATELHKGFSPLWDPRTPEAYKEIAKASLNNRFTYVNQHLGDHAFLMGQQYTLVDAYLFTILTWTDIVKVDIGDLKPLVAYKQKIQSRAATMATLKQEGLM